MARRTQPLEIIRIYEPDEDACVKALLYILSLRKRRAQDADPRPPLAAAPVGRTSG